MMEKLGGRQISRVSRVCGTVLVLLLFLTAFSPVGRAESLPAAIDFTRQLTVSLNGKTQSIPELTDGSIYTKVDFQEGTRLTLSSAQPFSSIYLIFDRPPAGYHLNYNGIHQSCGGYGFLHDYTALKSPTAELEITLPAGKLCDIYAFSEGELPGFVQKWIPPYDDCDMLLIPTHADDEDLYFGAIMPTYAGEKGRKLQVAYLTNHWGEPYRPHELLDGLWEAGITAYPVISPFPDFYSESLEHAKTLYHTEEIIGYLTMLLRRFQPEVVIGHDLNGEYGHGVHRLNAWALTQAVEYSGDASFYPESAQEYGVFDVPKTYLHLYQKNELVMDVDSPLNAFGGKTAFEKAQDAYQKHKSQQQWWFRVEKSGKYDLRKFGLYRTTVGLDSGIGDFFENVPPIMEPSSSIAEPESTGEAGMSESSAPAGMPDQGNENSRHKLETPILAAVILTLLSAIAILTFILRRKRNGT